MAADIIRPVAGWEAHASCAADPDAWFPDDGDELGIAAAKQACKACPVRELCLAAALTAEGNTGATGRYGIFGGLDRYERYRKATGRTARIGRPTADCGTDAAYRRHMYRGEEVDEACQEAHRAYGAAYYHQAKARAAQAEAVA